MSTEKAEAIVIRQADFSESSRVVTFFSREFGKLSALAKGAKRLKGPFDAALDLLSTCRIVFIRKSSGALHILTQASLVSGFAPAANSMNSLYGGYYVADLLSGLTADEDPNPHLYKLAVSALRDLENPNCDPLTVIVQFEIGLLQTCGLFPNLTECSVCSHPIEINGKYAHWVSQGGLLCRDCRREEYAGKSISAGTIAALNKMVSAESQLADRIKINKDQAKECHRLAVSTISGALGRKPGTLRYLNF